MSPLLSAAPLARLGRYLIYDGPLNVYRNFFEADAVIRQYEVNRVHTQLNSVWSESYFTGQSNYSLTLGFARDLNKQLKFGSPKRLSPVAVKLIDSSGRDGCGLCSVP